MKKKGKRKLQYLERKPREPPCVFYIQVHLEFLNVDANTDASTIVKSLVRESARPMTPNTTKRLKGNFPRFSNSWYIV